MKPSDFTIQPTDLPDMKTINQQIVDRIKGSIFGMAIGDALGAHVEFKPNSYLRAYPVQEMMSGGTWGLEKGQVLKLTEKKIVAYPISSSSRMIHPWLSVWRVP